MAITGQRYGLLAGLAVVAAVTLGFLVHNYTGESRTSGDGPVTDRPVQDIAAPERLPSTVLDEAPAQPRVKKENDEKAGVVSVSVTDAHVLVEADEASLQQVLDALVSMALVDVVDMRPASDRNMEADPAGMRTFSISGSVDEILDYVMDQYNISYVISRPPDGSVAESQLARLYLHGTSQAEAPSSANDNGGTVATQATSTAGAASAQSAGGAGQEKVNVSDLLRKRAQSTSRQPVTPATGGTGQGGGIQAGGSLSPGAVSPSGQASTRNTDPISGDYRDKETQARLAEMTRQASREVQALVESLRASEQALKTQQQNQFGDTQP